MSRWRPPSGPSTALITREGFERLRDELNQLWRDKRPEVVRALAAAAAEGDRSENAEYTYRKKQLGEIDRRVRYLSKRLEVLKVVDALPADREAVFFGAWFDWSVFNQANSASTALLDLTKPMPGLAGSALIRPWHARC